MMWDDHDIFDGWGSYSDEEQASPVFQTIFDAARAAFIKFQLMWRRDRLGLAPAARQDAFNALLRFGDRDPRPRPSLGAHPAAASSRRQSWEAVFNAVDGLTARTAACAICW